MRISVIQLLLCFTVTGICLANKVRSQNVLEEKVSITVVKESLRQTLLKLEKAADIKFVYSAELVDVKQKVSVQAHDRLLGDVLRDLFTTAEINFDVASRQVILSPTSLRYLPNAIRGFPLSSALLQDKTVAGVVKGTASGSPLPGVTIVVKGTNVGTITDAQGRFRLSVSGNVTLVLSLIGYDKKEVPVTAGDMNLALELSEGLEGLNEIIVIGYGTVAKRDLTGSISTIKGKEIADRPATNPIASIQGKVPGVYIVNSGRPGAEPDVRIRGTSSINGVKPLYVVDGIFNDNINFVNPSDIESMEILKDASSLAIYGVRGANGVIIISTKRAKTGQLMVNFNTSLGVKQVVNKIKMTDGPQFRMLYDEQLKNQGSPAYDYTNWQANTNWQDEIFQNGILNYNNISVTGATEKNRFYMSLGYMKEEGMIKHEELQKITLNINDEFRVSKALKFGFNFNGYRAELPQERNVGGAVLAAPIAPAYNKETGLLSTLPNFQRAQIWNPLVDVELRKNTAIKRDYRAVGSVYTEVNILKDLTFKATLFADYGFNMGRMYDPIITVYNPESGASPNPFVDSLVNRTGVGQYQNIYTKIQQDYLLTYKHKFGEHDFTFLGGITSYYNAYEETNAQRTQGSGDPIPNNPKFWYVSIGDPQTSTTALVNPMQWETATFSYLFRGLYSYKSKYLLNASFRRDGSSAFYHTGQAWQNFGAVGGAWVVSEEEFMKGQTAINYLKVKGSWGILGSQNIGSNDRYPAFPLLNSSGSAVFGNNVVLGLAPAYIADPNLHWETVRSWEAGLELNVLSNRLHIEGAYYNKLTRDILVSVPGIAGTIPGLSNLGQVTNKGIEFQANWGNNIGKDFYYTIGGNITTIKNNVNALSTTGFQIIDGASKTTAGYPIGYFYGYISDGIYQTDAEIKQSPVSKIGEVKPGDIKYRDVDGDGFITEKDRTLIGNPTPDFTYGISLTASYKGFDFGLDLTGVYGNEIFRSWNRNTFAQFNYQAERLDRWHGPGTSNWEPILNTGRSNNYLISTYYIEDGSFFRIRNIQIGYNFNYEKLSKLHIQSLRIYVNAQNLQTFKNNTGYTSEFGGSATSFGVDNGSYPLPAIYSAGINLNF
jgi:TonB-linked SusC/RagA family outer membrane protein